MKKKIILGTTIGFLTLAAIGVAGSKVFEQEIVKKARADSGYTITIGGEDGQWLNSAETTLKTDQNKNDVTFFTKGLTYSSVDKTMILSKPESANKICEEYNIMNKTCINQIAEIKIYGTGTFQVESGYFEVAGKDVYNNTIYAQAAREAKHTITQTSENPETALVYDFSEIEYNYFLVRNTAETDATINKIVITFAKEECVPAPSQLRVIGNLIYQIHDTYASICGFTRGNSFIDVEQTVEGLPVTKIEPYAFKGSPDTFYGLRCVPSSLVEVGEGAFEGINSMYTFCSTKSNGQGALSNLTVIGDNAFKGTKVPHYAFNYAFDLNINLSNKTYLGQGCFDCSGLMPTNYYEVQCGSQDISTIADAFGNAASNIIKITVDCSAYTTPTQVANLTTGVNKLTGLRYIGNKDDTAISTTGLYSVGGMLFENREYDTNNDSVNDAIGAYLVACPNNYSFRNDNNSGKFRALTDKKYQYYTRSYETSDLVTEDCTLTTQPFVTGLNSGLKFIGIDANALAGCINLKEVHLTEHRYISIGKNAFNGCSALKFIYLHNKMWNPLKNGDQALYFNSTTKEVMHLAIGCFNGINNLEYIALPRAIRYPDNFEDIEDILKLEGVKIGITPSSVHCSQADIHSHVSPSLSTSNVFSISEDPAFGLINYIKELDHMCNDNEFTGNASTLTAFPGYSTVKSWEAYNNLYYNPSVAPNTIFEILGVGEDIFKI